MSRKLYVFLFVTLFSQLSLAQLLTPPLKLRDNCMAVRLIQNQAVVNINNVNRYLVWAIIKNCGRSSISLDRDWPVYLQESLELCLMYDRGDSTFQVSDFRCLEQMDSDVGYYLGANTYLKSGDSSLFSFRPFFEIPYHLTVGKYSFQLVFTPLSSSERSQFFSNKVSVVVADD